MQLKYVLKEYAPNNPFNIKFFEGTYKKFRCNIIFEITKGFWYFCVDSYERNILYNSWSYDNINFKTKTECIKACEKYINEVIQCKNFQDDGIN